MARKLAAVEWLVQDPSRISRVNPDGTIKQRRIPCAGGCGRLVWDGLCRKCRRQRQRNVR